MNGQTVYVKGLCAIEKSLDRIANAIDSIDRRQREEKKKAEKSELLCHQCGLPNLQISKVQSPWLEELQIVISCRDCKATKQLDWSEELAYKYGIAPKW